MVVLLFKLLCLRGMKTGGGAARAALDLLKADAARDEREGAPLQWRATPIRRRPKNASLLRRHVPRGAGQLGSGEHEF